MPKLQVTVKHSSVNPCRGVRDQHLEDREAMPLHHTENPHRAVGGVELLVDVAVDLRDEHDAHRVDCHEQHRLHRDTYDRSGGLTG